MDGWRKLAVWSAGLSLGVCTHAFADPPPAVRIIFPAEQAPAANPSQSLPLYQAPEGPGAYGPAQPKPPTAQAEPPAEVLGNPTALSADSDPRGQFLLINLPTALSLVNAANPTIALARERVQEAYDRLREVQLAWLPDLRGGPAYQRHDGEIQNAAGIVFQTSKSSLFIGGGAVMAVDTSEAFFGPVVARRLVDAQRASAQAVTNNVQLDVALTYLDLLRVYAALAVNADTLARTDEMVRFAEGAEKAGLVRTTADPNRARAELERRKVERIDLEGQAAAVSARLAQLLLLQPTVDLLPADPTVLPISLVPVETSLDDLVATGLLTRPELAESRALVQAALARWRQARVGPFIPRLEFSDIAGDFGGGQHEFMGDFHARNDAAIQATWELHNLGAGDVARARIRRTQYNETNLHVQEVQAQVAAEVTAAAKLVRSRLRALDSAQEAVRQAEVMWSRLREASRLLLTRGGGRFDTIEPLLAEQALNQARTEYLTEVIEYNRAQFRLYWALGQPPLCAVPQATAQPVAVPVVPKTYASPTPVTGSR